MTGNTKVKTEREKFSALLYLKDVNGLAPDVNAKRPNFEDLTPIFPNERIRLEQVIEKLKLMTDAEFAELEFPLD